MFFFSFVSVNMPKLSKVTTLSITEHTPEGTEPLDTTLPTPTLKELEVANTLIVQGAEAKLHPLKMTKIVANRNFIQ